MLIRPKLKKKDFNESECLRLQETLNLALAFSPLYGMNMLFAWTTISKLYCESQYTFLQYALWAV